MLMPRLTSSSSSPLKLCTSRDSTYRLGGLVEEDVSAMIPMFLQSAFGAHFKALRQYLSRTKDGWRSIWKRSVPPEPVVL